MTRHAALALIGLAIAAWGLRSCAHPAASGTVTTARVFLPWVGMAGHASATWAPSYPEPRTWRWDEVAVVYAAGKPTPVPTPTRSATPTPTHPPRATRTPRATGTPTQGRMNTVPACGPGTLEPGDGTPHPGCWPYNSTLTATPTPAETATPTPRDTPPASATWEPTPTPRIMASRAGLSVRPANYIYLFPMLLNRRGVWTRGAP